MSVANAMFALLVCAAAPAFAQTSPSLGAAHTFAVLGASAVTNIGTSIVSGDLGVSPGTVVTGFPPGLVTGTIQAGTGVAAQAQADLTTAYNALAGATCTRVLTGMDLGGLTLTPGVYCFATTAGLTGALTLDALGDPNAVFVFQIGSSLVTGVGASVLVTNGGQPCNVFWQVGTSATLGTSTALAGNILAHVSITLNTGASVSGRALARTGAVTLDSNTVTACCLQATSTPIGAGCSGSMGQPAVLSTNRPVFGTNFVISISSPGTPNSWAFVRFGFSRTVDPGLGNLPRDLARWGAPGCMAYCSDLVWCLITLDATGMGQIVLRVPNEPAHCGCPICIQALILDPAANALGAIVTSAVFTQLGT